MNHFARAVEIWALLLAACALIVTVIFLRVDVPTALHFWNVEHLRSPLNAAFGSAVIVSAESAVVLSTVLTRLVKGHISVFGETLAIACAVSMCAYVVNDHVLKPFFGVPNITAFMGGAGHTFNLWMGSLNSSFPSGHMVLAGAFAGVFMRLNRASIWLFTTLLVVAASLLLFGDWHFCSDIIAGAFVGTSAGFLAGEGWAAHSMR